MRDLALALIWMVLLPCIVLSASMGVLSWVWVALLAPNELLYGFMAGVPLNRIVAVLTLGCIFLSREKKDAYLDAMLVLLILFAMVATASWATSIVDSADGDQYYQKIIKEIALAFAITAVTGTRHRLHMLAVTCCLGLGLIGTKEGLIFLLTAGGHKIEGLASIGDNNSLATALLMLIPMLYYCARHSAVHYVRLGFLGVLGLSVVTVIATYSRGGFVGLLVLGAFMVKNSRSKFTTVLLVAIAGAAIYALAPESWFARLNSIDEAGSDGSFLGRVMAWKASWLIALDHPFLGGGLHAVQRWPVWEMYRPGLRSLEWLGFNGDDSFPRAAHSSYFEVLGDLGFTGLFLFLGILAVAMWQCRSTYRIARLHPSLVWAADLSRMLQISLVVYMVTTALLSMAYTEFFYILLAMITRTRRTVLQAIAAEARGRMAPLPGVPAPALPARPRPAYARQASPG